MSTKGSLWPSIPPQLVEFLNKLVPEKCPTKDMTDRDIWEYVGKREIVRTITRKAQEQQDSLLLHEEAI